MTATDAVLVAHVDHLERRIDMLSRTVAVLVNAAMEDACEGLTSEQVSRARRVGVEAMVQAVDEIRTGTTR